MNESMIFHPLSFNSSIWVKALELVFKHCRTQIPQIVGTFDISKQCYWIACATHAVLQKCGIPSVLTGGHAVWRYEKSDQIMIYADWCTNLPSPGKNFEGHCWVETDDSIVDFSVFWFYKKINKEYTTVSPFTRKDQLLTFDELVFEEKEGCYYKSIDEYINTIELCHQTMDCEYQRVVSEPVFSVFKRLFINLALYLYLQYSEEYLSVKTI